MPDTYTAAERAFVLAEATWIAYDGDDAEDRRLWNKAKDAARALIAEAERGEGESMDALSNCWHCKNGVPLAPGGAEHISSNGKTVNCTREYDGAQIATLTRERDDAVERLKRFTEPSEEDTERLAKAMYDFERAGTAYSEADWPSVKPYWIKKARALLKSLSQEG